MINRNWDKFQQYSQQLLFEEQNFLFCYFINKSAFSSHYKIGIYQENEKYFIYKNIWDRNKDIEKYYNILKVENFNENIFKPTILKTKMPFSEIDTYLSLIDKIHINLPLIKTRFIVDGDENILNFGKYGSEMVTLTWQGNLPANNFIGVGHFINFIKSLI